MKMMIDYLKKLQNRWNVSSVGQVVAILIVFTLTGSTVVLLRPLLFNWVGVSEDTSSLTRWMWYIGCVLPAYQLLLLGYGWLFGQSQFFIRRYRKMVPTRFASSK